MHKVSFVHGIEVYMLVIYMIKYFQARKVKTANMTTIFFSFHISISVNGR